MWRVPDLDTLLRWTLDPEGPRAFQALPETARAGVLTWLRACTGAGGALVLAAVEALALDVLPLGIVVDLATRHTGSHSEVAAAAVRLERYTGGLRIEQGPGQRWADAAVRVLRTLEEEPARQVLGRADQLAAELVLATACGVVRLDAKWL